MAELQELWVMVGLPRSGKSTWALRQGHPVVSADAIRLALHGERFLKQAERFVHVYAEMMVDALFAAGHKVVILDECNIKQRYRAKWVQPERWLTRFIYVPTSSAVCRDRAISMKDWIMVDVVNRMAKNWEELTMDDPEWKDYIWIVDMDGKEEEHAG